MGSTDGGRLPWTFPFDGSQLWFPLEWSPRLVVARAGRRAGPVAPPGGRRQWRLYRRRDELRRERWRGRLGGAAGAGGAGGSGGSADAGGAAGSGGAAGAGGTGGSGGTAGAGGSGGTGQDGRPPACTPWGTRSTTAPRSFACSAWTSPGTEYQCVHGQGIFDPADNSGANSSTSIPPTTSRRPGTSTTTATTPRATASRRRVDSPREGADRGDRNRGQQLRRRVHHDGHGLPRQPGVVFLRRAISRGHGARTTRPSFSRATIRLLPRATGQHSRPTSWGNSAGVHDDSTAIPRGAR